MWGNNLEVSTFDELVGRLPRPEEVDAAVHPRVLTLPADDGDAFDFAFVAWRDPGGAKALHEALGPIVEATLLAELSNPEPGPERLNALHFVSVEPIDELQRALQAFGFVRSEPSSELAACIRGEASACGLAVPDAFGSVWTATVGGVDASAITEELAKFEWPAFGVQPGALARLLGTTIDAPPTPLGLDQVEAKLVDRTPGVVRWIEPRAFLALCDFVAVVLARAFEKTVQWAPSDTDEDGFVSPPLVRMKGTEGWVHLPLGLHVLRWCVMPLLPGEEVPPLSHWAEDQSRV